MTWKIIWQPDTWYCGAVSFLPFFVVGDVLFWLALIFRLAIGCVLGWNSRRGFRKGSWVDVGWSQVAGILPFVVYMDTVIYIGLHVNLMWINVHNLTSFGLFYVRFNALHGCESSSCVYLFLFFWEGWWYLLLILFFSGALRWCSLWILTACILNTFVFSFWSF